VQTGDIADTDRAYAIDVVSAGLSFTEILLADYRAEAPTAHTRAYRFQVLPGFLTGFESAATLTGPVQTVLGDCNAAPTGPTMLRNAGRTSLGDVFFFRDIPTDDQHRGLHANGFDLAYSDCARGASLDGMQGVVFVK
jgi:hypothetical protein